jgi:prepilin-type N-terminal cleavage/methylation domain-containing protein
MAIRNSQAGVTLVELVVVLGIFGFVASVLIFNYSDFSSNISVRTLSQEVGLAIRKAQSYATSVRTLDAAGTNTTQYPAYGISFSFEYGTDPNDTYSDEKQFAIFTDIDGGNTDVYDTSGGECGNPVQSEECVELFTITSADRIAKICAGGDCDQKNISIVFRRPSPDATICIVEGDQCVKKVSHAQIFVESAKGLQKQITVWNTGQISVQ